VEGGALNLAFTGSALIDSKYRVERCLGRGGMGAVYRARHIGLDRCFAVKIILAERRGSSWRELFEHEAKALGRLKHPNILDVTDYGIDPRGMPYLVTELLEGQTLEAFCCDPGGNLRPVPIPYALPILESVATAVDLVHAHGMLHRDLKLNNVFLAGVPKLMDFGLAALVDSSASDAAGTPDYMAPERISGQPAGVAADIYAFGVMAFAMLTGRMPFEGDMAELFRAHLSQPPPVPSVIQPGLPGELDAPLRSMLAKDPAQRPATATEGVRLLREAWLAARRREWKAHEIPRRLWITAGMVAAMVAATFALERWKPFEELELRTVDARFAAHPRHLPDPRIMVVMLDEPSLSANHAPISEYASDFGTEIEAMFGSGAKTVALDFELPEAWSRSPEFSKLVLNRSNQLVLGLLSGMDGQTIGAECIGPLTAAALSPEQFDSLFAFVNLDQDPDGSVRHAHTRYADRSGAARRTWAASAVEKFAGGSTGDSAVDTHADTRGRSETSRFWIDYTADFTRFEQISWKDVPERLTRTPESFRGRLVLVGADFLGSGDENHASPLADSGVPGTVLQALIANSMLQRFPVRDAPRMAWLIPLVLLSAIAIGCALLMRRPLEMCVAALAVAICFFGIEWMLFRWMQWIAPIAAPLAALAIAFAASILIWRALPSFPE
jgi:serine/threonine protein kinase